MIEQNPEIGPTIRHDGPPKPFEFAAADTENATAIDAHIRKWVGEPETVFHELISDKVHIDIHIVKPTAARPYYTLVTSGMSDRPMNAPQEASQFAYGELYLCLPANWAMSQEAWKDAGNYWPVRALKYLARFPHTYDTWLSYGHTIPNGNPPAPIHNSTRLSSFILMDSFLIPKEFCALEIDGEKTIYFYAVVPLYEEELALKLQQGAEALKAQLEAGGCSEVINPMRPSCVQKRGFWGSLFGRK